VISLIATVLNEGESLQQLLDSIQRQSRPPDEIVIVDGGSQDDTIAILRRYQRALPLRILHAPGCNISAGRNRAIRAAQGDIIAVTDAGVRLDEHWLERLSAPLLQQPALQVAGGFFRAAPQSAFELALSAVTLPLEREIDGARFLPSSRSIAYRKAAAVSSGLYPEWLDYCEDLVFDLQLQRQAGPFAFVPAAIAHFRPRSSLRAYFRQYYRYARGDGKADLWRKRQAIRYACYLLLAPGLGLAGALLHPLLWALYLLAGAVYLWQPYRRLPVLMRRGRFSSPLYALYCCAMIPYLRFVGDVAKMLGYPAGWRWRRRHRR